VTVSPVAWEPWDPGPREPRILLRALLAVLLVAAGVGYAVWWTRDFADTYLSARYRTSVQACDVIDLTPFASLGKPVALGDGDPIVKVDSRSDCVYSFDSDDGVRSSMVLRVQRSGTAASAREDYPALRGVQDIPIGDRPPVRDIEGLAEEAFGFGMRDPSGGSGFRLVARDSNLIVRLELLVGPGGTAWSPEEPGPALDAMATSVRGTLAKMG
jgi:hypothetical protein